MKYPEILLLPALMFTDYFLTVYGAILRERKYARHFKVQHYELNPLWQKSISQKKWFNLRHTLLVVAVTLVLAWAFESGDTPDGLNQVFIGAILVAYGMVVARHVANILLFRYVANHPDQVSGEVTMTHPLALSISLYQTLVVMIPTAMIAIFSRNNFARGGFLGTVLVFCVHLRWRRKSRKSQVPQSEPAAQSTPGVS